MFFFREIEGQQAPREQQESRWVQFISRCSQRYQPPKGLGAQGDSWNSQFKKQNQKKKVILNPPVPLPPQKCSCLYFHLLNFFLCFFFPTHFHVGRESPLPAPVHQYHSSEKRVGFLYSCNISRFLNLQKAKFSSSGNVLQYLRIKLPSAWVFPQPGVISGALLLLMFPHKLAL